MFESNLTLADFYRLYDKVDKLIEKEKVYEMPAIKLIEQMRNDLQVIDHCVDFFFGYAQQIYETSFELS